MRFTHRHADGGLYAKLAEVEGKDTTIDEKSTRWVPGVLYRAENGKQYWTDKQRWDERFTTLPEAEVIAESDLDIRNEEEQWDVGYHFTVDRAGDVIHMMISAAGMLEKGRDHHTASVLKAQVEMIQKGLHIRDLEEVPDFLGDVNRFHAKFGQEYLGKPRMLPEDLFDFRVKFHDEETHEYRDEQPKLVEAVARQDQRDIVNCLELQLDALCDAAWVILGTADLQFGRKVFNEAWRRVVTANMAKVRADTDDGSALDSGREKKYDIRKPPGWKAPDHRDLVTDHEHQIYRQPGQLNQDVRSDTQVVREG